MLVTTTLLLLLLLRLSLLLLPLLLKQQRRRNLHAEPMPSGVTGPSGVGMPRPVGTIAMLQPPSRLGLGGKCPRWAGSGMSHRRVPCLGRRLSLRRARVSHRGVRQGLAGEGGCVTVATSRGTMSQSVRFPPPKLNSDYQ